MTVAPKSLSGLQVKRVYNQLGRVEIGGAASLGVLPSTHPRSGEAPAYIPLGKPADILLTQSIIDRDTNVALEIENNVSTRSRLLGGVLNGMDDVGNLQDGVYYVFMASLDETPDARGYLNPDDTFFYISPYSPGFGVGSDPVRGGRGEFDRPINPRTGNPIRYIRQMKATYQIQDNKLAPWLGLGEGNTVEMFYTSSQFKAYKSARLGGVKFRESGAKYFVHEDAVVPIGPVYGQPRLAAFQNATDRQLHIATVGANLALRQAGVDHLYKAEDLKDIDYSLFHVIPQTHKTCVLDIEYEGDGIIYMSVTKELGSPIAYANGRGVVQRRTSTGSDATGRGVTISILGDVVIHRVSVVSTTSQQPM